MFRLDVSHLQAPTLTLPLWDPKVDKASGKVIVGA